MSENRIQVKGTMCGAYDDHTETYRRYYAEGEGLKLIETRGVTTESDYGTGSWRRESPDNGRTWGAWIDVHKQHHVGIGEDESVDIGFEPNYYDWASGNMTVCGMNRYFVDGHTEAYRKLWDEGITSFYDHCYLVYRRPDGTIKKQFLAYEEGSDFDPENPRSPAYFNNNRAYFGKVQQAANGDLLIPLGVSVNKCCEKLGLSLEEVFPSCPNLNMRGVLLVRAHWEPDREEYTLSYSKPVVINDLLSSRGVDEPTVAELKSGRILIVFRGSNWQHEAWKTRIEPGTPGFKWYLWSDDGGKTFTQAMPWHFDTREVVYSSASISHFFRSTKNGHLYWIGNITDPQKTFGNYPRYPLVICQVDEQYGCLIKDTLTVIDTRHEDDSEFLQLSNFGLLENRETLNLEIRLSKLGKYGEWLKENGMYTEAWTYEISFD